METDKDVFSTGSQRDKSKGKVRWDLIPIEALKREAILLTKGAETYGERNWELGQPFSRTYESLLRHLMQWREGDRSEDHLAAVVFGANMLMTFEERIKKGTLPGTLNDLWPVETFANTPTKPYYESIGDFIERLWADTKDFYTIIKKEAIDRGFTREGVKNSPPKWVRDEKLVEAYQHLIDNEWEK
jgi:hypothetical protein